MKGAHKDVGVSVTLTGVARHPPRPATPRSNFGRYKEEITGTEIFMRKYAATAESRANSSSSFVHIHTRGTSLFIE